jgi:hypothetical protein
MRNYQNGVMNKSADRVKRSYDTWSDTDLDGDYSDIDSFTALCCRMCNGKIFEVLITGSYETSARCVGCGMYYIVHCG